MSFSFSEPEQVTMIRRSVRAFAEKEIAAVARELDEKEQFSVDITQKMADLGLFGMCIPEKYSGQGMDYLSYIVAVEELARIDGSQAATIAAHNSLGCGPILYFGTEEQKQRLLPQISSGGKLWAFGLSEADAGSDAQATNTRAVFNEETGCWVINGAKMWITNSSTPLTLGMTVQAITGKRSDGSNELSCFLVPIGIPGVTIRDMKGKMMWRSSSTGEIFFDNVQVPADSMLGNRGQGFAIMMKTLDQGRLSIGAMGLGLAKGAYQLALRYAMERQTFGKPIFQHQAISFKFAEMATRIEAAENMLYKAAWLKDNNQPFAKQAAMAKLYCSEVAEFCAREGQQIFGGFGLMKDYHIERHYRDAALLRIGEGTSEILKIVISRYISKEA